VRAGCFCLHSLLKELVIEEGEDSIM
jgi:hypothetical protein